jgi:sulfide:quinone oxidoreductase
LGCGRPAQPCHPVSGVYALGADAPVHRAGVFADTAARAVADDIAAKIHSSATAEPYDGTGSCYIEFGAGLVGKVDADFLSGPVPKAPCFAPSAERAAEKERFAAARRRRWFGI